MGFPWLNFSDPTGEESLFGGSRNDQVELARFQIFKKRRKSKGFGSKNGCGFADEDRGRSREVAVRFDELDSSDSTHDWLERNSVSEEMG